MFMNRLKPEQKYMHKTEYYWAVRILIAAVTLSSNLTDKEQPDTNTYFMIPQQSLKETKQPICRHTKQINNVQD